MPNDCLKSAQIWVKHSSDTILKKNNNNNTHPKIFSIIERCFSITLVTVHQRVSAYLAVQKHLSNSVDANHAAAQQSWNILHLYICYEVCFKIFSYFSIPLNASKHLKSIVPFRLELGVLILKGIASLVSIAMSSSASIYLAWQTGKATQNRSVSSLTSSSAWIPNFHSLRIFVFTEFYIFLRPRGEGENTACTLARHFYHS